MKLDIELIPQTAWGSNLRKMLSKNDWDKIRKAVYQKENMHCHICGCMCTSMDAHEVWDFNEHTHVQKLVDIIGICKDCHNTIHLGRAEKIGLGQQAKEHFLRVNQCDRLDLQESIMMAQDRFRRLSAVTDWKLDLSFIEKQGFHPTLDKTKRKD